MDPRLWRSSRREYGDRVPDNVGDSSGRSRHAAGRPSRQCCARGRSGATASPASSGHHCRVPPSPRTRDPATKMSDISLVFCIINMCEQYFVV